MLLWTLDKLLNAARWICIASWQGSQGSRTLFCACEVDFTPSISSSILQAKMLTLAQMPVFMPERQATVRRSIPYHRLAKTRRRVSLSSGLEACFFHSSTSYIMPDSGHSCPPSLNFPSRDHVRQLDYLLRGSCPGLTICTACHQLRSNSCPI